MRIEEEIEQKVFQDIYQKTHINVLFTAAWLNQHVQGVLKPYRISWQQFNILRILRGMSPRPASVKLLTRRMIDKTSNASRLVEKLSRKGLVDRQVCPEDRRQAEVTLTQKGHALLEDTSAAMSMLFAEEFNHLSPDEAVTLNKLLDKMRG